jgi:hypothetical protein
MTTTPENPMPLPVLVSSCDSPLSGTLNDNYGGYEHLELDSAGQTLTVSFEGLEGRDPAVYEDDGTALYTDVEYQFVEKTALVSYLSDFLDPDTISAMEAEFFGG